MMAMAYGNVYVAHVAFGAKDAQTVKAFQEAESYPGPSLIIAYSHCIAHGYDLANGLEQQKLAVDTGYWPLFRFDPRRARQRREPRSCWIRRRPSRTSRGSWRTRRASGWCSSRIRQRTSMLLTAAQHEATAEIRHLRAARQDDHARDQAGRPGRVTEDKMDLSTRYLGLRLAHPLMPGASPLADSLDTVKRLEDAGAAAIVMRSLFEEQITRERDGLVHNIEVTTDDVAEALAYFPKPDDFVLGPDEYLEQIRRIKAAVQVPVIASLNGTTNDGWLTYAKTSRRPAPTRSS